MEFWKKLKTGLFHGVFEFLLIFPLILIGGIALVDDYFIWQWIALLVGLFIFGLIFRSLIPRWKWWVYTFLAFIIGIFPAYFLDLYWHKLIIAAIVQIIFVFRGMMYGGSAQPFPVLFMWFGGFAIYFFSYFIIRFNPTYYPYMTLLTIFAVVTVAAVFFISNRETLIQSTLSKKENPLISRTVKRQNRFYILLTFGFIILLANISKIQEALGNAFRAFLRWLLSGSSEAPPPITEEPSSGPPMMPPIGEQKNNPFLDMLYFILTIIAVIVVVGIIILLLLLIIKKVRQKIIETIYRLFLFLKEMLLRAFQNGGSDEYEDEKESIFDWKEWRREQQDKLKNVIGALFKREPRWDSLTNQEKVRYVYKKLLEKEGLDRPSGKTPREILSELHLSDEELAALLRMTYEEVRYGELDVEKQIAHKLRAIID